MRIQNIANVNVVFKFLPEANIKLENIGVMDIVDGTPTPTLGLIWSIIAFYLIRDLGGADDALPSVWHYRARPPGLGHQHTMP